MSLVKLFVNVAMFFANLRRSRHIYNVLGSLLIIALWFITDPDSGLLLKLPVGASTVVALLAVSKGILGASILFFTRKMHFDYFVADYEEIGKKATETSHGAGLYSIGIALNMVAYAIVIVGMAWLR